MNKVKWIFRGVLALILGLVLWYTLPQHDVVRVTEVYNRITTVSWANSMFYAAPDSGTAETTNGRDIRFISAVFQDGSVMVYRNEDTGWIWPPYFKYDSSNLQAEATNLKSTKSDPQWVSITHYGWRMPIFSIYPNAVKITAVEGPDVRIIPWVNIVFLTALLLGGLMLRRMWLQFIERAVEPAMDDVSDVFDAIDARSDAARDEVKGGWGRFTGWLGRGKAKTKR